MPDPSPTSLRDLRVSYDLDSLTEDTAPADPHELFNLWLADALAHQLPEPNAMTLSTLGSDGGPNSRTVLLKGLDLRGFHFFTNYDSRKGRDLAAHPQAALTFLWAQRHHQVSIRGHISKLPREDAETYFASRPAGHQIGAWVSDQSTVIPGREWLEAREAEVTARFAGGPIPCPPNWGGYTLLASEIEFWQGRVSRLHDRLRYTRQEDSTWKMERLSP
ncbi:pyridoxamine 5'-phosphate oxidase [Prosthecobacter sp. SYSU 5D2]|uniref:pyridoxamine 5'-phosphate oxidase n=1 Tax=Prosthecobacter sp. SYSU 5D2 TaxID=3134134 RepID=UPI0031FEE1FC